ncbi:glutaredoxin family protein [Sporolactobacillus terrae]|uniref:glutaredoxin family protein n=1 Tax=Sporolactobacillus terrae TaxID=269673 RepID=UPI00048BE1D5|nr:glutaredoxin [Sporolactobacillus terrae]
MNPQRSIIIWSKQACPYCLRTKNYLTEKHLNFVSIDVTNHDDLRDVLEMKYGIRHVPVIEIGLDQPHTYEAVTSIDLADLEKALKRNQVIQ